MEILDSNQENLEDLMKTMTFQSEDSPELTIGKHVTFYLNTSVLFKNVGNGDTGHLKDLVNIFIDEHKQLSLEQEKIQIDIVHLHEADYNPEIETFLKELSIANSSIKFRLIDHQCIVDNTQKHSELINSKPIIAESCGNADLIVEVSVPARLPLSNLRSRGNKSESPHVVQVLEHNSTELSGSDLRDEVLRKGERKRGDSSEHGKMIKGKMSSFILGLDDNMAGILVDDKSNFGPEEFNELMNAGGKQRGEKVRVGDLINEEGMSYEEFNKNYIVVPCYVNTGDDEYKLREEFSTLSEHLNNTGDKRTIIPVVASRCYDSKFWFGRDAYKGDNKVKVIPGLRIDKDSDYTKMFQLAEYAIIGGDKTLELAVSAGAFPIYVAPKWKSTFYRSLKETLHQEASSNLWELSNAERLGQALKGFKESTRSKIIGSSAKKLLGGHFRGIIESLTSEKPLNNVESLVKASSSGNLNVVKAILERGDVDVNGVINVVDASTKSDKLTEKEPKSEVDIAPPAPPTLPDRTAAPPAEGEEIKVRVEVEGGELFTGVLSRWTAKCSDVESLKAAVLKKVWKKDGDFIVCNAELSAAIKAGEREIDLLYDRGGTMVRLSEDYEGWIANQTKLRIDLNEIDNSFDDDVNHDEDNNSITALMEAVEFGHIDIVKYLLEKGADVNHKDNNDKTALTIAQEKGYIDIEKLIIESTNDNKQKAVEPVLYKTAGVFREEVREDLKTISLNDPDVKLKGEEKANSKSVPSSFMDMSQDLQKTKDTTNSAIKD